MAEQNPSPESSNAPDEDPISKESAETVEVVAALADGEDQDASETNAIEGAQDDEEDPDEPDNYLQYLSEEYQRYRLLAVVLAVIGFAIILGCLTLIQAGVIPNRLYGVIMSVGNLFIVLMAVVIFTRSRPFKRRIKEYTGQPKSKIRDENAPDGVLIVDRGPNPDTEEVYKILERDIRTELIPETPEYQKLRKQWLTLLACAGAVALASIVLYMLVPALSIVTTLTLLAAFILVIAAFYVDRTKMKPLRDQWARAMGMTEFQARNAMDKRGWRE